MKADKWNDMRGDDILMLVSTKDDGRTPLHVAIQNHHLQVVSLLLEALGMMFWINGMILGA